MTTIRDIFGLVPSDSVETMDFPFYETIIVPENPWEVRSQLQEIQVWLVENIGDWPQWHVDNINVRLARSTCRFLFKHPEDVTAFKLRWL